MKQYILKLSCIALAFLSISCSKEELTDDNLMKFTFNHPNTTKVTETAFENNDKVGVYVTTTDAILESAGNYVTNNQLTYDGTNWNAAQKMYWNNGTYNVYAYYPYRTHVESIKDLPINVSLEQNIIENYTASDFLWASKENVTASNTAVNMTFAHKMSRLFIQLVPSSDYTGDIPSDAKLYVHNVVTEATADLNVGNVTVDYKADTKTLEARNMGNKCYSAIIVPQRISSRTPLIEVVMNGVSYLYESSFLFKPGVQHNVSLTISKNPSQIKIEVGGEITNWN